MPRFLLRPDHKSGQFVVLIGFLALVFMTGGSARPDVGSLIILRPTAVLVCAFAALTLSGAEVFKYRFLIIFAFLLFLFVALHLLPLPEPVWRMLPGHRLVAEIDKTAGLGDLWRPLSLVPTATRNAFFSLFVPLAVLLLGIQLSAPQRIQLALVLVALVVLSEILSVLQIIGPPNGALYLYNVTNNGTAVGLFANHNHNALLLATLFPLVTAYGMASGREHSAIRFFMIGGSVLAIPLLLIIGSRSGALLGVLGLLSALAFRRRPYMFTWRRISIYVAAAGAIMALIAIFLFWSRALAIDRLVTSDHGNDLRFRVWGPIFHAAWQFFPFGSGIGSFVEVFKMVEPDALLSPTYLNHAHNDWLEVFLTGGILATALIAAALCAWARQTWRVWQERAEPDGTRIWGRAASIILLMIALASISDYPLRVPSIMCFFTIGALWLHDGATVAVNQMRRTRMEVQATLG